MIRITRRHDGTLAYDYSVMQRYIDLFARAGISGEIEVFGITGQWWNELLLKDPPCAEHPDPILLRAYDEADGCYRYLEQREEIEDYIRSLESYFKQTGQIERVRISADEPADAAKYQQSLERLHQLAPSFRYKAAVNHAAFVGELGDKVEDFAPSYGCVCREYAKLKEFQRELPDHRFLWYVCCDPERPNSFLHNNLLDTRFLGTLNAFFGFDGLLRWSYTCWTEQPRHDIRYFIWYAGDLCLVYPAANGELLLSLRWKSLKRGIEDYELLQRLRDRGREDVVSQVFELLYHQPDATLFEQGEWREIHQNYSTDYADYAKARELMLDALKQ